MVAPADPPPSGGDTPDRDTYRTRFEQYDEAPTEVVHAVATVLDTNPTDLPPLRDIVDFDGLEDILYPPTETAMEADLTVSFTYEDCRITITRRGLIEVVLVDDAEDAG